MADLGLRERLQPSLFDRLIDEERLLTLFELTFSRSQLREAAVAERELKSFLLSQGLVAAGGTAESSDVDAERLRLRFSAPVGRTSAAQLGALQAPGAPPGVTLQQLCEIEARNIINDSSETSEQRLQVARRLREIVSRDIGTLLNAVAMETVVDLEPWPLVRQSVLNFGLPATTGKLASSVNREQLSSQMEAVIRRYEPRLSDVRVTPDAERGAAEPNEVSLRIDALLWGQPAPFQVVLHTSIDTESGKASVRDMGGQ